MRDHTAPEGLAKAVRTSQSRGILMALVVAAALPLAGCRAPLEVSSDEFVKAVQAIAPQIPDKAVFYEKVGGEPHRVVEIAENYYWYYNCSDGKVILIVNVERFKNEGKVQVDPRIRKPE